MKEGITAFECLKMWEMAIAKHISITESASPEPILNDYDIFNFARAIAEDINNHCFYLDVKQYYWDYAEEILKNGIVLDEDCNLIPTREDCYHIISDYLYLSGKSWMYQYM